VEKGETNKETNKEPVNYTKEGREIAYEG